MVDRKAGRDRSRKRDKRHARRGPEQKGIGVIDKSGTLHAGDQKTRLATLEIVACRAATVAAPRDCILRFGRSTSGDKKEENIYTYPLKVVKNTEISREKAADPGLCGDLNEDDRRVVQARSGREREEGLV